MNLRFCSLLLIASCGGVVGADGEGPDASPMDGPRGGASVFPNAEEGTEQPILNEGKTPPVIHSLLQRSAAVTESRPLTVSAIVSDPDGIRDLIGGQLLSADGAYALCTFVSSADEGAYTCTVSWQELVLAQPFLRPPVTRSLRAVFYDTDGDTVEAEVQTELTCFGDAQTIFLSAGVPYCKNPSCVPLIEPCPQNAEQCCALGECKPIYTPGRAGDPCGNSRCARGNICDGGHRCRQACEVAQPNCSAGERCVPFSTGPVGIGMCLADA